jgi:hypothetical protein
MKLYEAAKGTKALACRDMTGADEYMQPYVLKKDISTSVVATDHIKLHNNPEYFWEMANAGQWEPRLARMVFDYVTHMEGFMFTKTNQHGNTTCVIVRGEDVNVIC